MVYPRYAHLALRIGVAVAFLYPPVSALSDPASWLAYFPPLLRALPVDELFLLHGFGLLEALLALWILSGWRIRIPAAIATALLAAIVLVNWAQMDVLFRDISIALMTLALALSPTPSSREDSGSAPAAA